jgi:hypothetical protein
MDEPFNLSILLYVAIAIGLLVVLTYAGLQFVAGLKEAKREHDARSRAQAEQPQDAAAQVVRRRRW